MKGACGVEEAPRGGKELRVFFRGQPGWTSGELNEGPPISKQPAASAFVSSLVHLFA